MQTDKGNGRGDGVRAGCLAGGGKRNGKENKTLRPDPKGQLSVGQESRCVFSASGSQEGALSRKLE